MKIWRKGGTCDDNGDPRILAACLLMFQNNCLGGCLRVVMRISETGWKQTHNSTHVIIRFKNSVQTSSCLCSYASPKTNALTSYYPLPSSFPCFPTSSTPHSPYATVLPAVRCCTDRPALVASGSRCCGACTDTA